MDSISSIKGHMTSLVMEYWKPATVWFPANKSIQLGWGEQGTERDAYVFVPGSVPLEWADHNPPILGTWSEAGQVITTVEWCVGNKK